MSTLTLVESVVRHLATDLWRAITVPLVRHRASAGPSRRRPRGSRMREFGPLPETHGNPPSHVMGPVPRPWGIRSVHRTSLLLTL